MEDDGILNAIGTGTVCCIGVERFEDVDVFEPLTDESLKIKFISFNIFERGKCRYSYRRDPFSCACEVACAVATGL